MFIFNIDLISIYEMKNFIFSKYSNYLIWEIMMEIMTRDNWS